MRSTHYGYQCGHNTLTDFASSGDRIAVWRSILPQHFNTIDGHWTTEGSNCSLQTWKGEDDDEREIQLYNIAAKYAFLTNCVTMDRDHHIAVITMNTIVQSIGHLLIIGQCTSTSLTIIVQNNWQDLSSHQTLQDECSSGTLLTCLTCHIGMLAMGIVVTFATWYHCTRLHLSVWGCYCPSPVRLTSQQQFDQ